LVDSLHVDAMISWLVTGHEPSLGFDDSVAEPVDPHDSLINV
jgi:hypothetical protein